MTDFTERSRNRIWVSARRFRNPTQEPPAQRAVEVRRRILRAALLPSSRVKPADTCSISHTTAQADITWITEMQLRLVGITRWGIQSCRSSDSLTTKPAQTASSAPPRPSQERLVQLLHALPQGACKMDTLLGSLVKKGTVAGKCSTCT